jgi:ribonucleoside-diphosphate reductase alpha chain
VRLAAEKGAFPAFERDRYLERPFVRALPRDVRDAIAVSGIRNSHLLAIAPAGTTSLLAGNVSSGLEPVFAAEAEREVTGEGGALETFRLVDHAVALWRERSGRPDGLPRGFVGATDLPLSAHLQMQAALQPYVDNSISKTINAPAGCSFEAFRDVYDQAYDLGLKGCTVFRPNPVTGAVLTAAPAKAHCCTPEREAD